MNNGVVICANLQVDNPVYLCVTPQGQFYTCTVGKVDGHFFDENISFVTKEEAMKFVAQITQEAMSIIHGTVPK
ncbi:MAG: hypothetical protein PUC12_06385 [Clostridiales bacterium]|nr:hypothetical protein [Clostridiales bacterium]